MLVLLPMDDWANVGQNSCFLLYPDPHYCSNDESIIINGKMTIRIVINIVSVAIILRKP